MSDDEKVTPLRQERREYFRIEDEVLLLFEPLPGMGIKQAQGFIGEAAFDSFQLSSDFNQLKQSTRVLKNQLEKENRSLMRFLGNLDHKIDKLAVLMLVKEMQELGAERLTVDIGADGMGFDYTGNPVAIGETLDIRLGLLSTSQGLRTVGEVVRCNKLDDGRYNMGVRFEHANEAAKELLVQHVLQRQAQLLRKKHDEEFD